MTIVAKRAYQYLFPVVGGILLAAVVSIPSAVHGGWLEQGTSILKTIGGGGGSGALSTEDIASGLKEALRVGTENVTAQLGQTDGFAADSAIHIPLPGQLETVRSALAKVGMSRSLDDLELKLNRAAELATPKAKALFWDTISQMRFADVERIYKGPDDAATRYFQEKMTPDLSKEMEPIISQSLSQVGAVQTYDQIMGQYKSLPFVPDVKADLTAHVIDKGLDGIFYYVAKEEAAIRNDPVSRTTDILKKVFGKP